MPASPSPINGDRIADRIYSSIRHGILAGDLPPGHRIRQGEVASEYEVSHTPVREAIARLAAEGLVTLRPRRGAEVNPLDPADVEEIYAVRLLLEPAAVAMALANASLSDRETPLREAQSPPADASPLDVFEHNRRFHRSLYAACGNRRLVQILDSLWESVTAVRMFDTYASRPEETARSTEEHLAIGRAVERGDDDEVVRLLDMHLRGARDDLLAVVDQMEDET